MTKKKILIGIAVLIIVVLGAVALEKYNTQRITLEKERLIAQCRQEVNEMDEKQLIGKINTLPIGTPEELEKVRNSNALMYKHLRCRFFEEPFEERFEETKGLIEATNFPAEKKARMIEDFNLYLKSIQDQDRREAVERRILDPSFSFIIYPEERICPESQEKPEILEALINKAKERGGETKAEKTRIIVSDYCAQISRYSKDPSTLAKEIYEFKDYSQDSVKRQVEYRWKAILASRFGGKEKALEVCDNLSVASEKKDCQDRVDNINGWPTYQIQEEGCMGYEMLEIKNLICQSQQQ